MDTLQPEKIGNKVNKFMYVVSGFIIAATIFTMFIFYYLLFIQGTPRYVSYDVPFRLHPLQDGQREFKHGDTVILHLDSCQQIRVPNKMVLSFLDGLKYEVPEKEVLDYKGLCVDGNINLTKIPNKLPPGVYSLHISAQYKVNFLVNRTIELHTEQFTVLPN